MDCCTNFNCFIDVVFTYIFYKLYLIVYTWYKTIVKNTKQRQHRKETLLIY
jgi:hypothetical protein